MSAHNPPLHLEEGEAVVWAVPAQACTAAHVSAIGELVLTTNRVVFVPARVSWVGKLWSAPRDAVVEVRVVPTDSAIQSGGMLPRVGIRAGAEVEQRFVVADPEGMAVVLCEALEHSRVG